MTPEELSERLWLFAARVGKVVDALPDTRLVEIPNFKFSILNSQSSASVKAESLPEFKADQAAALRA